MKLSIPFNSNKNKYKEKIEELESMGIIKVSMKKFIKDLESFVRKSPTPEEILNMVNKLPKSCSTSGARLFAKERMSIEGTVNSIELNQQRGNKWVFVGLVFTNYGNKTFMLEIECFNDKYSVLNVKVL